MPFSDKFQDGTTTNSGQLAKTYALWQRNPDPHNSSQILSQLQPTIDKAIMAHVGQTNPLLRSRARRLTLGALSNYDPSRGTKLETHVINHLRSLKRISRQQSQIIHVPERISLEQAHLHNHERELADELGREPTAYELADRTGLSLRRIAKIRQTHAPMSEGFFTAQGEAEGSEDFSPAVESAPTQSWPEMVYDGLDPHNQKILEWTLGLHGQPRLRNQQIAAKLGLSPGAISQRKAFIQQQLDQESILSPF